MWKAVSEQDFAILNNLLCYDNSSEGNVKLIFRLTFSKLRSLIKVNYRIEIIRITFNENKIFCKLFI